MADITLRNTKGSELTYTEGDNNWLECAAIRRNVIINGDFRIAQRGRVFNNPVNAAFTLDRWRVVYNGTGGTFVVSQQPIPFGTNSGPGEPKYYLRWNQSTAPSGDTFRELRQSIESALTFSGEKVTLSFWAKSGGSSSVTFILTQEMGTGGSTSPNTNTTMGTAALSPSWQKFSYTINVPSMIGKTIGTNGNDSLLLRARMPMNTTFVVELANIQLERGNVATEFENRSLAHEIALCERYYQKSYNLNTNPGTATDEGAIACFADDRAGDPIQFATRMRTTPSVTVYSPDSGTKGQIYFMGNFDVSPGSILFAGERGFTITGHNEFPNQYKLHYEANAEF